MSGPRARPARGDRARRHASRSGSATRTASTITPATPASGAAMRPSRATAAPQVDAGGRYAFRTIRPVAYPGRTPHIHFKVHAPGRRPPDHADVRGGRAPERHRRRAQRHPRPQGARERDRRLSEAGDLEPGALKGTFDIVLASDRDRRRQLIPARLRTRWLPKLWAAAAMTWANPESGTLSRNQFPRSAARKAQRRGDRRHESHHTRLTWLCGWPSADRSRHAACSAFNGLRKRLGRNRDSRGGETSATLTDRGTSMARKWFLAALLAAATPAAAHDWYPMECCSRHGLRARREGRDASRPRHREHAAAAPAQAAPLGEMLVTTKHGSVVVPANFPDANPRTSHARLHAARPQRRHAPHLHLLAAGDLSAGAALHARASAATVGTSAASELIMSDAGAPAMAGRIRPPRAPVWTHRALVGPGVGLPPTRMPFPLS